LSENAKCADPARVGEDLRQLDEFFETDATMLRRALQAAGRRGTFVSLDERDALFLSS
jgi:hypothetical protein